MEIGTRSAEPRSSANARRRPFDLAFALLPVFACFLGGGTEKWSEGLTLVLLGGLIVFDPPRHGLGYAVSGLFLAFLVVASFTFLPASWFFEPDWRAALANDYSIALPGTVSPQPWATLQCLFSVLAGLVWL